MSSRTVHSYLADLGEQIAANGVVAGHGDLLLVAGAARLVSPAAAAVLTDPDQPEVARHRALAVVSAAVLRDAAATRSLRQALVDDVVPRDPYPAAEATSEETLRQSLSWAGRHSPVSDALGRTVPTSVEVEAGQPAG